MDPRVMRTRMRNAQDEIARQAVSLAELLGIDPPQLSAGRPTHNSTILRLRETEGMAEFFGRMALAAGEQIGVRPVAEPEFTDLLGQRLSRTLAAAGYLTLQDLQLADDEALLAIEGVGPKALEAIRALEAAPEVPDATDDGPGADEQSELDADDPLGLDVEPGAQG